MGNLLYKMEKGTFFVKVGEGQDECTNLRKVGGRTGKKEPTNQGAKKIGGGNRASPKKPYLNVKKKGKKATEEKGQRKARLAR